MIIRTVIRTLALPLAGIVAWSRFVVSHDRNLPAPVPADDELAVPTPAGTVAVHRAGSGPATPVVLVHSVNAAASAYEMRPLFEHWRRERPVLAPDLPGFGASERGDRRYTPEAMAEALVAVLEGTGPAHVVALSLGCEFAARVALERPDLVVDLTLISPTGLGRRQDGGPPAVVGTVLRAPLVGQALYDLLVTQRSIRWFLSRSFVGDVDHGLVAYAWATAHQPGARFAPAAFLDGTLFTADAATHLYDPLDVPVLVVHDRDSYSTFERVADFVAADDRRRVVRIPATLGLPHFEGLEATVSAIEAFWADVGIG
ncbi:MAG: alpha/beta fold hydrolase [Acidimicrobiia bacterium]